MNDLLANFDLLPNKNYLWMMMRYISVIFDIYYNISIEIHKPRNTDEFFTYSSDKYWSKLIYGLLVCKTDVNTIMNSIHEGNQINLINFWKPTLIGKKYNFDISFYNEMSYYSNEYNIIIDSFNKKQLNYYHKLNFNENLNITNIISYVKDITIVDKITCEYLLKYIMYPEYINDKVINKFYVYLTNPPTDPCRETEDREDIINLILYPI